MDLYLIRHADALMLGERGITEDAERPLSEEGEREVHDERMRVLHADPPWAVGCSVVSRGPCRNPRARASPCQRGGFRAF